MTTFDEPLLEHDVRCPSWSSDDPSRCDCRDATGHRPDVECWADGPMCALDFETTGPDPETAIIVTATVIRIHGRTSTVRSWLADPGVEIPEGAAAVHGITTEHAREHGRPLAEVVDEVSLEIEGAWTRGVPVVAYNASYDVTVLQRNLPRVDLAPLAVGHVVDPLVLDRGVDRYRKGKRTLGAACEWYGIQLDNAHSSDADALAAARIAYKIAKRFPEVGRMPLPELQAWQAAAHRRWAEGFGAYLRKNGKTDDVSRDWPIRSTS